MAAIDIHRVREAAAGEDFAIDAVDETGSTNRVLMDAPFGAAPQRPRLLAAARQTAGRGRRGRAWLMEPGRSVAFSMAFEHAVAVGTAPPGGLSIAVGAAIAQALAAQAPDLRLKWPNDLQRAGRKIAGILVETRRQPAADATVERPVTDRPATERLVIERLVVGIGINLLAPRDPGARIGQPAGGLFDGDASPLSPEFVIGRVAATVGAAVRRLLADGLGPFREAWQALDALRDQPVVLIDSGGQRPGQGIARGIDEHGALLVETAGGLLAVSSGEVSLRAASAPGGVA